VSLTVSEESRLHLALFVANFELAEAREFQSKTVGVDVCADFRRDAVRHRVDDVGSGGGIEPYPVYFSRRVPEGREMLVLWAYPSRRNGFRRRRSP